MNRGPGPLQFRSAEPAPAGDDETTELMISSPSGFLWGAASAAHQIEGGNTNADMWAAEHAEHSIFVEPSGDACDSYHRYGEDIALLADAGLNTYRFSVEWARIEPAPGQFSRAALDHYRRVVTTCLDHGVTPMVSLHHFTAPRWFAERGGWSATDASDRFARYAEVVARHFGDLVPWICTINESNVLTVVQASGVIPLGSGTEGPALDTGNGAPLAWVSPSVEVMATAHRQAYDAVKAIVPGAEVGWTLALQDIQAEPGGEERAVALRRTTQLDWLEASRDDDFLGVQTYTRMRVGPDGVLGAPEGSARMQTGWEFYPDALSGTVRLAAGVAGVPIVVTEHGAATDDDAARIDYTEAALGGLGRCLADGIDVRGYLHWTLLDNFEWMAGYAKTFGLIAVDRETFERRPKPSLTWLGEVARSARFPVSVASPSSHDTLVRA